MQIFGLSVYIDLWLMTLHFLRVWVPPNPTMFNDTKEVEIQEVSIHVSIPLSIRKIPTIIIFEQILHQWSHPPIKSTKWGRFLDVMVLR